MFGISPTRCAHIGISRNTISEGGKTSKHHYLGGVGWMQKLMALAGGKP
ncbi:MAG TPA: hypothetical protein IGS52_10595 [Oscillatoriaceae cyanobacterium M33_DOE_052]|nr:hypothetical protein [Oscillatoriaceae cyanobacterium M33_DOE_052]